MSGLITMTVVTPDCRTLRKRVASSVETGQHLPVTASSDNPFVRGTIDLSINIRIIRTADNPVKTLVVEGFDDRFGLIRLHVPDCLGPAAATVTLEAP